MRTFAVARSNAATAATAALRSVPPGDPAALYRAGALAVRAGHDEAVLPILTAASARYPRDARLAQVCGLAARNLGDLAAALGAFERAHALAPTDALIAHSLARCRLEAGVSAVVAFAAALRLAPRDGSVIQGMAAARFAAGDGPGAEAEIDRVLRSEPLWLEGHATLARLRHIAGDPDDLRSYRAALAVRPRDAELWLAFAATVLLAERYDMLASVVSEARGAIGRSPALDLYDAIAADETGQSALASRLFAQLSAPSEPHAMVWHVRHLLRTARIDEAAALAERGIGRAGGRILWPYLALVWRLRGDPRWRWLEGREEFVRVFDLDLSTAELARLAAHLRALHIARRQPLDQSVRGGTQTDGPLFSRTAPEIVDLRRQVDAAITAYVAALPPPDGRHPLLSPPRDRLRFAGSWSVRLTDGGYHADHVHPQGWISSALYVALPEPAGKDGWLTLGSSRALLPDLAPFREIEPRPGRLVLFPSTMWHGTRRFTAGERLTVAFDVALLEG